MSSSPNEAAAFPPALPAALTPRLAGALAASIALHAFTIAVLDALPQGMRWGEVALAGQGSTQPLRVTLRAVEPAPVASSPTSLTAPLPASEPPPGPGTGTARAPALSPLPAPTYYTSRELDVRPGILVRVEPVYPEAAARRFLSGRVLARLLIDDTGRVEKVEIVSAEPPGYFEAAAERAFLAARFTPGMKGGRAVRVQLLLEIAFDSAPPPKAPSA